jgi:glycosyltransferase involved in cell wall biosynthesis
MTGSMTDSAQPARKFPGSLSLVAWGYNEEELVEGFLDRAFALLASVADRYEVVFVDDCSTDRTGAIVDAYAAREPRLRVIHNERNLNVGLSARRAVSAATMDYVFWQTVDWSYDLTHLATYLALLKDFDVVQGIRPTPIRMLSYVPVLRSIYRVKSRSDNFYKAVLSLGNYYLVRILFGAPFQDFQNVTIYPRRIVQELKLRGRSSFVNPEFLIRTYARGVRFIEVPIPFIPRSAGQAKGARLSSVARSLRDILGGWFSWGWRLRLGVDRPKRSQIFRVSEPFHLEIETLRTVLPLFELYR